MPMLPCTGAFRNKKRPMDCASVICACSSVWPMPPAHRPYGFLPAAVRWWSSMFAQPLHMRRYIICPVRITERKTAAGRWRLIEENSRRRKEIRRSARKHCRRRLIFFMPMQVEFPPNFLKWQYAVPVRKPFLFFVA